MNYPNGPYGQGFPGQRPGYQQPGYQQVPAYPPQAGHPHPSAYPQQPAFPQQSGYPGGPPPYGLPPTSPAPPSGVTGIIAGVLAGLGGLVNLVGGLIAAFGLAVIISDSTLANGFTDSAWAWMVAVVMLNIVAGVLLSIGTVMLLLRKMTGRWIVVAGCAVSMVSSMISFATPATIAEYAISGKGADAVGLIFPIATLVLVLLPSTAAWIQAKQQSVPPPYYPPYPPYRG